MLTILTEHYSTEETIFEAFMLADTNTITPLGFDELCVLLEETDVEKSVNLGSTILHLGRHVHLGRVVLVSTLTGAGACVTL